MPHKAEEAVDRRSQSTSQRPADRADPSAMETTWRRTAVLDEDPRMDGCCETSRRQEDKEWLSKRGLVSSVFLPRPSDQGTQQLFSVYHHPLAICLVALQQYIESFELGRLPVVQYGLPTPTFPRAEQNFQSELRSFTSKSGMGVCATGRLSARTVLYSQC